MNKGPGIDSRFPPFQEPKIESTSATTWVLPDFFLNPEKLVKPKELGTSVSQKKIQKTKKKSLLRL